MVADRVLSGRELAGLDDEALARAVGQAEVHARVAPDQKLRIVRALQGDRRGRGGDR